MANRPDDEQTREFWKKTGEKRGGEVGFTSFGRYLGRSGEGGARDLTGLIYLAAGKLWFETVESARTFLGFAMREDGKKGSYEAFETEIDLASVDGAVRVGLKDSLSCINGKFASSSIRPFSFFGNFFDSPAVQVKLRDGSSAFFEAARDIALIAALNGPVARP